MANRFFNHESSIWRGFSFTFDLIIESICWIICSLFIFTTGIASTSLYYTMNHNLKHGRANVLEGYSKSIKQNWKIAILSNLIIVVFGLLIAWSMWISYQMMTMGDGMGRLVFFFGLIVCVYYIGFVSYVFPTLASYHYDLKGLFSISFRLSIMHLPTTVIMSFLIIGTALLAYYYWISLFITPALIALIQNKLLDKIYAKHTN